MKYLAKEYKSRQDLEAVILVEVGGDIEKNKNTVPPHVIEGTREELAKLQLDDMTTVFGIQCVITDETTPKRIRGK